MIVHQIGTPSLWCSILFWEGKLQVTSSSQSTPTKHCCSPKRRDSFVMSSGAGVEPIVVSCLLQMKTLVHDTAPSSLPDSAK